MRRYTLVLLLVFSSLQAQGRAPFALPEDSCSFRLGWPVPIPEMMAKIDFSIKEILATSAACQVSPMKAAWEKFKEARDVLLVYHQKITKPPPENYKEESERLATQASELLMELAATFYLHVSEGTSCEGKAIKDSPQVVDLFQQFLRTVYSAHSSIRQSAYVAQGVLELSKSIPEFLSHLKEVWEEELAVRRERGLHNRCEALEKDRKLYCPRAEKAGPPNANARSLFRSVIDNAQGRLASLTQQDKYLGDIVVKNLPALFPKRAEITARLNDPSRFDPEGVFYDEVAPLLKHCAMEYIYTREVALANVDKKKVKADTYLLKKCAPFLCSKDGNDGLLHNPYRFSYRVDPFCQFADNYRQFEFRYLQGFKHYHTHRLSDPALAEKKVGQFCPPETEPPAGIENH